MQFYSLVVNQQQLEVIRDILLRDQYLVQNWDEVTSCGHHKPSTPSKRQRPNSINSAAMKQTILSKLQVWRNLVGQSANFDCLLALLKSRGVRVAVDELIRKRWWILSIGQQQQKPRPRPTLPKLILPPPQLQEEDDKETGAASTDNDTGIDTGSTASSSPDENYLHPDAIQNKYSWQRHASADSGIVDPSSMDDEDEAEAEEETA